MENEFTDIPFDPDNWRTDGRLYPAHEDSASEVDGFPNVTRFRSKGHETFIGANGAYEIHDLRTKQVVYSKPGTDGRGVWL